MTIFYFFFFFVPPSSPVIDFCRKPSIISSTTFFFIIGQKAEFSENFRFSRRQRHTGNTKNGTSDGVDYAVEIFELVEQDSKDQIMGDIRAKDSELADELQKRRLVSGKGVLSNTEINDLLKNL